MFDMSWGEVMLIGGVALIVIGPKDLPKALRTVGQMTTKVRRLAGEFQSQFNEAMREAELEDVKKEVEGLNRQVSSATSAAFNPIQTIRDELKGAVEAPPPPALPAVSDLPPLSESPVGLLPPDEEAGPPPPAPALAVAPVQAAVLPVPELTGPGLEQAAESGPMEPARTSASA